MSAPARCAACLGPIAQPPRGRRRRFCEAPCKREAEWARKALPDLRVNAAEWARMSRLAPTFYRPATAREVAAELQRVEGIVARSGAR